MSAPQYFPISLKLNRREHFLIWYSNDQDRLVVDDNGCLLAFSEIPALEAFAKLKPFPIGQQETVSYKFDELASWAAAQPDTALRIDCQSLLDAWNLLVDVAKSVSRDNQAFLELNEGSNDLYEAVFWGCNLPSITPPGEHFVPSWDESKLGRLAALFTTGIEMVKRNIAPTPA